MNHRGAGEERGSWEGWVTWAIAGQGEERGSWEGWVSWAIAGQEKSVGPGRGESRGPLLQQFTTGRLLVLTL